MPQLTLRPVFCQLAVLAAVAAVPSVANADSISFIRGGDVWVASADGVKQVQLTSNGGYSYQSRADDGSFIALHGRQLHRLSATGQLLAAFNTPVSFESAPGTSYFSGPFKPEISPDGSKVAYEYNHSQVGAPGCTPTWECNRFSLGIGYSYPDRQTSWDEPGLGRQSGWDDPSWIDNESVLLSDKYVYPNMDAIIDRPGDGNNTIIRWFEDPDAWHLKDAELSRRGDALAFVATRPRRADEPGWGQEDDRVTVYRMNGAPPAVPELCFGVEDVDRVMVSPSFAPDGHAIAFSSEPRRSSDPVPARIELLTVPAQAGGCASPAGGSTDLILDATNPDWSPAGVPQLPATPGPGPGPGPGQNGGGSTPGPGKDDDRGGAPAPDTRVVTKGGLTLSVAAVKRAEVLKRGLRPQLTVPSSGKVELTATLSGKTIAKGKAASKAAGTIRPKLSLNAAGKRALRKAKKPKVTVRFTFRPTTGRKVTGAVKVPLG